MLREIREVQNLSINATRAAIFVIAEVWAAALTAQEVLYLADTQAPDDGASGLYVVNWDGGAIGSVKAVLRPLPSGRVFLNHVDAMAASMDGRKLWLIDDGAVATHQLAYYDLSSDMIYLVDFIQGIPDLFGNGIDGAAMAPDDQLYVARSGANDLWTIDTATAEATLVGTLTDRATNAPIDVQGGDLVFTPDGVLYLWANNNRSGAPRGLYTVDYHRPVSGVVYAIYRGENGSHFRGLAIGPGGNILGSDSGSDQIVVVDPETGAAQDYRSMFKTVAESGFFNDEGFDHTLGDMATGPSIRCGRTIGYWKNHGWDEALVSLNGEAIDPDRGHQILWDARGRNFSMLFAQLIAAKLNCPECEQTATIDAAEAFLLSSGVTSDNYDERFLDGQQKREGAKYWAKLDSFNSQYACDEIE